MSALLNEMRGLLNSYSNARISLNRLVTGLEALSNALPSQSEAWANRFFKLWLGLEEVNALLLDANGRQPTLEEQQLLNTNLRELDVLIDSEASLQTLNDRVQ